MPQQSLKMHLVAAVPWVNAVGLARPQEGMALWGMFPRHAALALLATVVIPLS